MVDFRKLNDVMISDSFPISMILYILYTLGNSKYFSTLDCASGFVQIPAKLEYHSNTAFDQYEYKRMPVGLKGAPSTFQRLMSTSLSQYAKD